MAGDVIMVLHEIVELSVLPFMAPVVSWAVVCGGGEPFPGFVPTSALVVTAEQAAGVVEGQEWMEASHLYRLRVGSCQIYLLWPQ
jgi:hypothetical protein